MASSGVLVVIEAPGKVRSLTSVLRGLGLAAEVWATRGHFRQHADSLWPLGILPDGSEPGRVGDEERFTALRRLAAGRRVVIATDADQEGDVIARDVRDAVIDVASRVERVFLRALDRESVRDAFAAPKVLRLESAVPGDARRIVDRLIGHCFSKPGRPAGRVFSALLRVLNDGDPVVGHATLVLPASDGGAPFVARVPVTASTRGLWEARAATALPAAAPGALVREPTRKPWNFAQTLLRGALARPSLGEDGRC